MCLPKEPKSIQRIKIRLKQSLRKVFLMSALLQRTSFFDHHLMSLFQSLHTLQITFSSWEITVFWKPCYKTCVPQVKTYLNGVIIYFSKSYNFSWMFDFGGMCCVFQPANRCSTCRLLVRINFWMLKQLFTSF